MNWLDKLPLDKLDHSGVTLRSHLDETGSLLLRWGAALELVTAGRYHALYSTTSFRTILVPLDLRPAVETAIGSYPERLVYLYCMRDGDWFSAYVRRAIRSDLTRRSADDIYILPLRDGLGYTEITASEIQDLAALALANAVEQAPRLPLLWQDENDYKCLAHLATGALPLLEPMYPLVEMRRAGYAKEILQLPQALQWRGFSLQNAVVRRFDALCIGSLVNRLEQMDKSLLSPIPLRWVWDQLDWDVRLKCAIAPDIASRCIGLHRWDRSDSDAVIASSIVYQAGLNDNIESRRLDLLIPADGRWLTASWQGPGLASNLVSGCLLNFQGQYDDIWSHGSQTNGLGSLNGSGQSVAAGLVRTALDFLNRIAPHAFSWFADAVRVISIRQDSTSSGHGSSSWPHAPGLIGLINVNHDDVAIERLVSSILHEAIHNLLYMIELEYPFSSDTSRSYGLTAVSPWTGRQLPLASYIHACFVWFGIWHFWKLAMKVEDHQSDARVRELERSSIGFSVKQYGDELARISQYLRPDIESALASLPQSVQDA